MQIISLCTKHKYDTNFDMTWTKFDIIRWLRAVSVVVIRNNLSWLCNARIVIHPNTSAASRRHIYSHTQLQWHSSYYTYNDMSKTGRLTNIMKTQLKTVNWDDEKCKLIDNQYGEYFKVHFYGDPQCLHCNRCTSYSNSVCLSVTRRYCVKTTARSTVQFALSDNKCV